MKWLRPAWALSLGLLGSTASYAVDSVTPFGLLPEASSPLLADLPGSSLSPGAVDRLLSAYSHRLATSQDGRMQSFLNIDNGAGLSLLCDSGLAISTALGEVAEHCLLGQLDGDPLQRFSGFGVELEQQLRLGDGDTPFDLSFGLSWLESERQSVGMGANGFNASEFEAQGVDLFDPRFAPSAGLLDEVSGQTVAISGTQWLSSRSWLRVTGQSGRYRGARQFGEPLSRWNSSALSLQGGFGDFTGALTGRQIDGNLGQGRRAWFDIDLGLSWRTPWAGKFTVGARNLLNNAANHSGNATDSDPRNGSESRTPYVRYQQDL